VRAVAARYLDPDAVSGVVYLPEGEGSDLTADTLARPFAVSGLQPLPVVPTTPPVRRPPVAVGGRWEAEVLHVALPGADLLVRRKPGVPLVTLGLYAPRVHLDPPAQAGLGSLTVRSSVRGADGLDAGGLAFAFERLGGTLSPSAASDWLGLGTTVLAENLAEAASLIDLVYSTPRLAEADVERERGLMIAEAEQVTDDMFGYPFQLAFETAFGEQAYGLPVMGLPHTLPAITPADVSAWHSRALLGVRPVVIAVGDVEPDDAAATLSGVFQGHPPRPPSGRLPAVDWVAGEPGGAPSRVVRRDKAQVALAMGFPGPARGDPDRGAAQVWAAVASGLGGRLFESLRDRRSLAYTVVASAWQKARAGALVTYIATSPEREDEARETMLEELDRFTREPVSVPELKQAINYLAGQAEVSRQSGGALAGEILDAWVAGRGLGELVDPAGIFRKVTAEDVQRVAARSLDRSRRVEGVVRGTGATRPRVAALQS